MRGSIYVFLLACAQATDAGTLAPLGLCPTETSRLDGFMQMVCAGERALTAGRPADAITSFRKAVEERRLDATNELAWAGLAAAYCQSQDTKRGREWATRFEDARRLWLGEADCNTDAGARRPQAFVREHLCVEPLETDYRFVRNNPEAAVSNEIRQRLSHLADRIDEYCSIVKSGDAAEVGAKKAPAKKSARKKSKKKLSGKAVLPVQGR